jgi:hypothetical protein
MIRLEVRQAQTVPMPAANVPAETPIVADRKSPRVVSFAVLIAPPGAPIILAQDPVWAVLLEKESTLAQRLAAGAPFEVGGYELLVTGATPYSGGRVLYECVGVLGRV